jgi:hypothetical protein
MVAAEKTVRMRATRTEEGLSPARNATADAVTRAASV